MLGSSIMELLSPGTTGRISVRGIRAACLVLSLAAASASVGAGTQFAGATPAQVGVSPERLARLDEYMKRQVADGHIPGAVILLARHGKIVAFNSYGEADPDRHVPMSRDAIFRIYSQTKVVTGVAMMMLFEEGKWHFDDPVTRFLPELKSLRVSKGLNEDGSMQMEDISRPPTMRELLTHSAGFGYGLTDDNPIDKAYYQSRFLSAANGADAVERILKLPLASQPGLHWRYSAATDIQGYIVERISGLSLADFMQSRIFGPLQMKDTGFYVPASQNRSIRCLESLRPQVEITGCTERPAGIRLFAAARHGIRRCGSRVHGIRLSAFHTDAAEWRRARRRAHPRTRHGEIVGLESPGR